MRILLVDDDDAVRGVMQETLQCLSFEVTSAANVSEATQLIVSEPFDVLITDLRMPYPSDGLALVDAMRSAQPHALTILISGFVDAAHEAEADVVLEKPFSTSRLAEIIRSRMPERKPAAPSPECPDDGSADDGNDDEGNTRVA